jgi:hypothetical protein
MVVGIVYRLVVDYEDVRVIIFWLGLSCCQTNDVDRHFTRYPYVSRPREPSCPKGSVSVPES